MTGYELQTHRNIERIERHLASVAGSLEKLAKAPTLREQNAERRVESVYTVVGVYTEPFGQRFATTVKAESAREAERLAVEEADQGLIVAGVVKGRHAMADIHTDGLDNA